MSILVVHGSVETSEAEEYIAGLRRAAQKGYRRLAAGSMEAAVAAVEELEDDPLFSAGYGSVLNRDGYVEIDASLMEGVTGRFAAVAAMPGVRHGVKVAQFLLEEGNPLILAGRGAAEYAREKGLPPDDCISEVQLRSWQLAQKLLAGGEQPDYSLWTGLKRGTDTVGCILCSDKGELVAASSTGGAFLKHPGRVGDTPIIGGGIFASGQGAVLCTGHGESFIRTLTAKYVDEQLTLGVSPQEAAEKAIRRMTAVTGQSGGVIVLNERQQVGMAHNSSSFPVVIVQDGRAMKGESVKV